MKKIVGEFKEFIARGNVIDLAVGVVIGSAFGKIVTSLVNDILMPLIGVILGGVDFTSLSFKINALNIGKLSCSLGAGRINKEDIIDYGGISKDKVLSYLDFFIRLNKQKGIAALDKWKMDREHIANYRLGSAKRVRIGNVTVLE